MPQTAVFTESAPTPRGFYSQAVRAGDFLYIAGQLPLDRNGQMVQGSVGEQARATLRNVEAILKAAGAGLAQLVSVTVYVSDVAHWPEVNRIYEEVLREVPVPPARAVVPVKDMHYGALVEIQATAYLGA
jgi:2-iminobutanoate/2-iminopropanoate deaminase